MCIYFPILGTLCHRAASAFPCGSFLDYRYNLDPSLVLPQLIFTFQHFRVHRVNYFCQLNMLSPQFVINFNYVSVFQVKDKSLDTIYRAISYTQRPKHSDLDLGKDLPRLFLVYGALALHLYFGFRSALILLS
jgi:hypothetical protein